MSKSLRMRGSLFVTAVISTVISTGVSLGCASGEASNPIAPLDLSQVFWKLDLNTHAVTLSVAPPSNTIQLVGTPLSALGTPLTTTAPVTFVQIGKDTSIQVTSAGLITAHSVRAGINVTVEAKQTIGAVTLRDTAVISVTATPLSSPLASLTLHVLPGDTAKVDVQSFRSPDVARTLSATVLNQNGVVIPNAIVRYWSSDTRIAGLLSSGVSSVVSSTAPVLRGVNHGRVMLHAETTLYGVTVSDSLPVTVTPPLSAVVLISSTLVAGADGSSPARLFRFDAGTVTIAPGGAVAWYNAAGQPPFDIVFDDSTAVQQVTSGLNFIFGQNGAGNIPAFVYDSAQAPFGFQDFNPSPYRARLFPTAGTYPYHSTLFGTAGTVIVTP